MANLNNEQALAQEERQEEVASLARAWDELDNRVWRERRVEDAKREKEEKTAAEIAADDQETAAALTAWAIIRKSERHSRAAYAFENGIMPGPWGPEKIKDELIELADAMEMETQRQLDRLENDPAEVRRILGKNKKQGENENGERSGE